jgi:hypothetical protein
MKRRPIVNSATRIGRGIAALSLTLVLLGGCQGWLHGADLGLHGPDKRIEKAHRATHRVVIRLLEQDYEAVENANVVDPTTGAVTRENLEKQFRLLRMKALQLETMDALLRAVATYNGVDIDGEPGEARTAAGKRASALRSMLKDIAKEQGKDLGEGILDDLRGEK